MTYQEAIEILHPDTTREAIRKIECHAGNNAKETTLKVVEEACLVEAEGLKKLMAYEKTELTPEQIYMIDKLYTKKCRELAELKKKEGCNV